MIYITIMPFSTSRKLDLNLLVILGVLLETRNATATAARLNMSQPSVSRALARLRDIFGDKLLVKGARGLVATPRAESLAEAIADLLANVEAVVNAPRFDPATSERTFTIATTDYGALAVLPSLSSRLAKEAPGVSLQIRPLTPDAFRRLSSSEIDLALYSDDPVPGPLRTRKLFVETYTCVAREGHPALKTLTRGRMALDTFLAHSHVLVNVLGGQSGVVDDALAAIGRERRILMWLPYFATAALVVSRRDLILTLPDRAIRQLAASNGLVRFKPPVEIEGFGYQMVWHERSQGDHGSKWLRDTIAAVSKSA
jgi:DNA-binding transcriptional LysR family regulator